MLLLLLLLLLVAGGGLLPDLLLPRTNRTAFEAT
jgi:hypothetical protein